MGSPPFGILCYFLIFLVVVLFPAPGTSSLTVISPENLKGRHQTAMAKFGNKLDHGDSIGGTVVYPSVNQKGCEDFGSSGLSFHAKKSWTVPTFLLVDRGDCYFALKVWNAQKVGAIAVLIADYAENTNLVAMDSPIEESAISTYLHNITIPSVLVSKSFGDQVKQALSSGEIVNMKLGWSTEAEGRIGDCYFALKLVWNIALKGRSIGC
ncbi:hypothetical protein H6P81_020626 [Aristolochia fimbriata]|uniref:PA domain-containing protein n=1 Tax=Aristolochia fimbriata TaxID=158543 RepID=A0AAV7DXY5_ARIFI|nr:hypothetical protein H6P81_020626 [Aristolochia fimbriata]